MKRLMPALLAMIILIPSVQATCLTTEQVLAVGQVSNNSAFLSVFDTLCDRIGNQTVDNDQLETYVNTSIENIRQETEARITNETAEWEKQADIVKALQATNELINSSMKLQDIQDNLDAKYFQYVDQIDEKLSDDRLELTGYATKEDVTHEINNWSVRFTKEWKEYLSPPDYTGISYSIIVIAAFILIYVAYSKKKEIRRRLAIDSSDRLARKHNVRLPEGKRKQAGEIMMTKDEIEEYNLISGQQEKMAKKKEIISQQTKKVIDEEFKDEEEKVTREPEKSDTTEKIKKLIGKK